MSERIPVVEAAVNPAAKAEAGSSSARDVFSHSRTCTLHAGGFWRVGITTATWLSGRFPYTARRASHHVPRRLWTMRQYAGMGDAEESNKRYKYCWQTNDGAVSGLRLPDADRPRSDNAGRGEKWQGGRGHRFDRGHAAAVRWHRPDQDLTSMTINATAFDFAGALCAWRGGGGWTSASSRHGQNDVLKEYIARGT